MSIERFSWFAHIFDLTIFPTDPTRQLSSEKFSLSALEGQSRPGRAFLASFYDFRPLNAFFAQFSTQETIWMLDFVVFHQTLDISIHSSQMVDIMTPELACFRRKTPLLALWELFDPFWTARWDKYRLIYPDIDAISWFLMISDRIGSLSTLDMHYRTNYAPIWPYPAPSLYSPYKSE